MKKYSYLAGAAFLAIASSASFATITLQVVQEPIDPTLAANGWVGYDLILVATGPTQHSGAAYGIAAIDFKNVVAQPGMPTSNIGISGDIHQEWGVKKNSTSTTSTPDDTTNGYDGLDSFFWVQPGVGPGPGPLFNTPPGPGNPGTPGYYGAGNGYNPIKDPATEDNNLQTGASNPPFTFSPETDIPSTKTQTGTDYGVGSLMTISGSFTLPFTANLELGFIIVPSSVPTTINGVAVDDTENSTGSSTPVDWAITTVLGGVITPEPASAGLLGLGAMALLARRRRKA